jgi:hypothetical protein
MSPGSMVDGYLPFDGKFLYTKLHGVTFQKTVIFIITAVRISDLAVTFYSRFSGVVLSECCNLGCATCVDIVQSEHDGLNSIMLKFVSVLIK